MKNLMKTGIAVLVMTALSACSLQENPGTDPTSSQAISVVANSHEEPAQEGPGTKTTLGGENGIVTSWVASTDQIGIFSPQALPSSAGEAPANSIAYTAQTTGTGSTFTGSMYWGTGNHHFYAYYPNNSGYTGNQTAVPISLPSAQTQSAANSSAHIGALDFLVAAPVEGVIPPAHGEIAQAVGFTLKHVFTILEFQIKGSGTLSQVSLSGANSLACTGTINLAQSAPAAGSPYSITTSSTSKYVTVTLGSGAPLNSGTAISVYMMIMPGVQSENLQIGVKIDGNWKEMSKAQPAGGFVRGKKYVVTLNTADAGWNAAIQDSRDSQIYQYKTIGTQVWMTENLAYLPSVVGPGTGSNSTAYYYVYGYDGTDVDAAKATSNYTTYGVLYNWPAAMAGAASSDANPSGVQGVCPDGWHLPSDAEWTQLEEYLIANGYNYDGTTTGNQIAKSMANYSGWNTSSTVGAVGNTDYPEYRNKSGFTALPGGYRYYNGTFIYLGGNGYWWSSTQDSTSYAWLRYLRCYNSNVYRDYYNKENGFSVRCVRD